MNVITHFQIHKLKKYLSELTKYSLSKGGRFPINLNTFRLNWMSTRFKFAHEKLLHLIKQHIYVYFDYLFIFFI